MSVQPDEVIQYLADAKHLERIGGWLRTAGIPHQDVADLQQDVVRETLESRESFTGGAVGGFVHKIARRLAADYHEKKATRTRLSHLVQEEDVAPTTPYDQYSEAQIDRLTLSLLEEVPDKYRPLLRARFVDGLDVKECATSFDMPVRTVQHHIETGLKLCLRLAKSRGVEDAQRHMLLPLLAEEVLTGPGADNDDGPATTDQRKAGSDRRLAVSVAANVAAVAVILCLLLMRTAAPSSFRPSVLVRLGGQVELAGLAAVALARPRPESAPMPAVTASPAPAPPPPVRCPPSNVPYNAEARALKLAQILAMEAALREQRKHKAEEQRPEAPSPRPAPTSPARSPFQLVNGSLDEP